MDVTTIGILMAISMLVGTYLGRSVIGGRAHLALVMLSTGTAIMARYVMNIGNTYIYREGRTLVIVPMPATRRIVGRWRGITIVPVIGVAAANNIYVGAPVTLHIEPGLHIACGAAGSGEQCFKRILENLEKSQQKVWKAPVAHVGEVVIGLEVDEKMLATSMTRYIESSIDIMAAVSATVQESYSSPRPFIKLMEASAKMVGQMQGLIIAIAIAIVLILLILPNVVPQLTKIVGG